MEEKDQDFCITDDSLAERAALKIMNPK